MGKKSGKVSKKVVGKSKNKSNTKLTKAKIEKLNTNFDEIQTLLNDDKDTKIQRKKVLDNIKDDYSKQEEAKKNVDSQVEHILNMHLGKSK